MVFIDSFGLGAELSPEKKNEILNLLLTFVDTCLGTEQSYDEH
jgi:hypothetical protein